MRYVVAVVVLAAVVSGCTGTDSRAGGSTPDRSAAAPQASPAPSSTSTTSCSATDVESPLPVQRGLPGAVAQLRADIDAAARDCDYERLQELALAGDSEFTASFGDPAPPAEYWRQEEQRGREPMRMLRSVLRLTYAERGESYAWPAAFARQTWEDVTPEERAALETLYDERDLRAFEQFGAYAGYRVVVSADGDWLAFVAGD